MRGIGGGEEFRLKGVLKYDAGYGYSEGLAEGAEEGAEMRFSISLSSLAEKGYEYLLKGASKRQISIRRRSLCSESLS